METYTIGLSNSSTAGEFVQTRKERPAANRLHRNGNGSLLRRELQRLRVHTSPSWLRVNRQRRQFAHREWPVCMYINMTCVMRSIAQVSKNIFVDEFNGKRKRSEMGTESLASWSASSGQTCLTRRWTACAHLTTQRWSRFWTGTRSSISTWPPRGIHAVRLTPQPGRCQRRDLFCWCALRAGWRLVIAVRSSDELVDVLRTRECAGTLPDGFTVLTAHFEAQSSRFAFAITTTKQSHRQYYVSIVDSRLEAEHNLLLHKCAKLSDCCSARWSLLCESGKKGPRCRAGPLFFSMDCVMNRVFTMRLCMTSASRRCSDPAEIPNRPSRQCVREDCVPFRPAVSSA